LDENTHSTVIIDQTTLHFANLAAYYTTLEQDALIISEDGDSLVVAFESLATLIEALVLYETVLVPSADEWRVPKTLSTMCPDLLTVIKPDYYDLGLEKEIYDSALRLLLQSTEGAQTCERFLRFLELIGPLPNLPFSGVGSLDSRWREIRACNDNAC